MGNKLHTEDKIFIGVASVIIFLFLFYLSFVLFIYPSTLPEQRIRVTYTIYNGGTPRQKTGIYKIKGTKFKARTMSNSHRYRPSDIEVTVESADRWNLGSPGTSICLYIGYSDVEVNKIEILKPKQTTEK